MTIHLFRQSLPIRLQFCWKFSTQRLEAPKLGSRQIPAKRRTRQRAASCKVGLASLTPSANFRAVAPTDWEPTLTLSLSLAAVDDKAEIQTLELIATKLSSV